MVNTKPSYLSVEHTNLLHSLSSESMLVVMRLTSRSMLVVMHGTAEHSSAATISSTMLHQQGLRKNQAHAAGVKGM